MNGSFFGIMSGEIICAVAGMMFGCAVMLPLQNKAWHFAQVASGYSVGYLVATVCFSLLPQAFMVGGFWSVFFSMLSGVLTMLLLQEMIGQKTQTPLWLLTIALYTFAAGLLLGSGFWVAAKKGSGRMMVYALQYSFLGASLPAVQRRDRKWTLLVFSALCALPKAAGCYIGALVGSLSQTVMTVVLAFSSGGILYGSFCRAVYDKRDETAKKSVVALMIGIFTGLVLNYL